MAVAFLHLQQGRDNNDVIGVVGVSLVQGHTGSRAAPAWNDPATSSSTNNSEQNNPCAKCGAVSEHSVPNLTWSYPVMNDSDLFVHGAISAPLYWARVHSKVWADTLTMPELSYCLYIFARGCTHQVKPFDSEAITGRKQIFIKWPEKEKLTQA